MIYFGEFFRDVTKIKTLRQNQHDIVSLYENLSQENLHDIVCEFF